ncbi:MAG: RNA 2',3'-cyclic phosphodiesterase [Acidimicrobiia bacterium]
MADLMRVFVAVPLDEETRHRLAHVVAERVPEIPGGAVDPQKWHLTLRFLGEVDEVQVDRIRHSLDRVDLGGPFTMAWGGLGAFPRPTRASVLWVGIPRGADELRSLWMATELALDDAGFPPEDRPFRPHLTIARIRPPEDVSLVVGGEPLPTVPMKVDRLALFQSRLGRGGAAYSIVDEFGL